MTQIVSIILLEQRVEELNNILHGEIRHELNVRCEHGESFQDPVYPFIKKSIKVTLCNL